MPKHIKLLVVSAFDGGWRWLEPYFTDAPYIWTFLRKDLLHLGRKALVGHALRAAWTARNHDVIITHGPWLTLFTASFQKLLRIRKPHLAFTFNHGNGLFFDGLILRLAKWALSEVDGFVTHSSYERALLSEKYGIPEERMYFTHWAVDMPPYYPGNLEDLSEGTRYVCCIGRNNRDFETFIKAVQQTGVIGVIVCRQQDADALSLPENVIVKPDISLAECQMLTQHALASIVPLIDDSTGAGHMTIVMSLLYGTPVIATESPVLKDYVLPGQTGMLVPRKDPMALAQAILLLEKTPTMVAQFRETSVEFAKKHLTADSAARFLRGVLISISQKR